MKPPILRKGLEAGYIRIHSDQIKNLQSFAPITYKAKINAT